MPKAVVFAVGDEVELNRGDSGGACSAGWVRGIITEVNHAFDLYLFTHKLRKKKANDYDHENEFSKSNSNAAMISTEWAFGEQLRQPAAGRRERMAAAASSITTGGLPGWLVESQRHLDSVQRNIDTAREKITAGAGGNHHLSTLISTPAGGAEAEDGCGVSFSRSVFEAGANGDGGVLDVATGGGNATRVLLRVPEDRWRRSVGGVNDDDGQDTRVSFIVQLCDPELLHHRHDDGSRLHRIPRRLVVCALEAPLAVDSDALSCCGGGNNDDPNPGGHRWPTATEGNHTWSVECTHNPPAEEGDHFWPEEAVLHIPLPKSSPLPVPVPPGEFSSQNLPPPPPPSEGSYPAQTDADRQRQSERRDLLFLVSVQCIFDEHHGEEEGKEAAAAAGGAAASNSQKNIPHSVECRVTAVTSRPYESHTLDVHTLDVQSSHGGVVARRLRIEKGESALFPLRHAARDRMLTVSVQQDDPEGEVHHYFGANVFMTNEAAGLVPPSRTTCRWRATGLEGGDKRLQVHPEERHAEGGTHYVVVVQAAAHACNVAVRAFSERPPPITRLLVGQHEQMDILGAPNAGCSRTAYLSARLGDVFGHRGSSLYIHVGVVGGPGNIELYVSTIDRFPSERRWQWKAVSGDCRRGFFRSINTTSGPEFVRLELRANPALDFDGDDDPRRSAPGVCEILVAAHEMGFGADVLHMAVVVKDDNREVDDAAGDDSPPNRRLPVSIQASVLEVPENHGLTPTQRRGYDLFNRVFDGVHGGAISSSSRRNAAVDTSLKQFTYGEVEFIPFGSLLQRVAPRRGQVFYDLGCGTGKALLIAAATCPFAKCVGIELLDGLYRSVESTFEKLHVELNEGQEEASEAKADNGQAARGRWSYEVAHHVCTNDAVVVDRIATLTPPSPAAEEKKGEGKSTELSAELKVIKGSFTEIDFSEADVVYASSICFPDEVMAGMTRMAERMKPGSHFITLKKIESDCFRTVDQDFVRMSWGKNSVYVQQRK